MNIYWFVSDLRHVGGFLQVLRFPPPIKLTATCDKTEILLKMVLYTIKQTPIKREYVLFLTPPFVPPSL